jgi:hypothetical protein
MALAATSREISGLLPAVIDTMTARSRSDSSCTMPADGIM